MRCLPWIACTQSLTHLWRCQCGIVDGNRSRFYFRGVSHSRNRLIASQLVSSVLCIGWLVFNTIPPEYYTLDRLLFGSGGWVFVIPTLFLAAFWLLVRETLARIDTCRLTRAQKVPSVWNSADIRLCGWYRVVEVWLLMAGLLNRVSRACCLTSFQR